MPYSEVFFNKKIEKLMQKWGYVSYFDIGIGAGKYGEIIKKIYPNAKLKGIEIDSEYINKFNLSEIYDEITHGDIKDYINENEGFIADVIIIGDLIEHLLKSEGIDLLNYLVYRAKKIIVVYPKKYIQYNVNDKSHEAHKSVWCKDDFKCFDFKIYNAGYLSMVVIDGYLDDKRAIVKPYG